MCTESAGGKINRNLLELIETPEGRAKVIQLALEAVIYAQEGVEHARGKLQGLPMVEVDPRLLQLLATTAADLRLASSALALAEAVASGNEEWVEEVSGHVVERLDMLEAMDEYKGELQ